MELQRFLIKERAASGKAMIVCDVFDPRTQEKVGVVREKSGALLKFLRLFLSKRFLTTKLEVCETEDESLVFTVYGASGLWQRRLEIYDADDHLMGYSHGGFWIYDRSNLPLAEIKGAFQGRSYTFVSPEGRALSTVTSEPTEPRTPVEDYLVSISDELAEQPLAKMLVLGTALALNIIDPGKGN